MKLEEARNGLKRFCEYEDSIVLTDNTLYRLQEMIETVLQELEDSISKEKVREIINKYSYVDKDGHSFMPEECSLNCIKEIIELVNFKLLEDK